ncbi:hypothetical protein K493DRAFT_405003 [Basidiobolus meristosporus CBS 931.73]|uniref:magnesium chelatase n=1 Tax=Basidiobolus meristosporus CBS 931.73 TaxID=1314790 RepID=A0A1Y1Z0N4_9FUNG|nr:hypothetical protein K493DRAFT_405003 [Basidiobolus meristosporus CBS 931.73]|eukprot:ORY03375.1 hypothetical protein K493DRAFT_405003 [Basidiobolus meristosporus CBS 931.73]
MSLLLCLIAGSKPLLLRTRPEAINDLAEMLEQMSLQVFGLNCARIDCSQIHATSDLYRTMFNKSKDSFLRPRTNSFAPGVTGLISPPEPRTSPPTSLFSNRDIANKNLISNSQVDGKKNRSFSVDDRTLEERKLFISSLRQQIPVEHLQNKHHLEKHRRKQPTVSFRESHKQTEDAEYIPLGRVSERTSKEPASLKPQRKPSIVYNTSMFTPKKLANIIVLEGLEESDETVQLAILEILSKGWLVDDSTVCYVPDPFVIVSVMPLSCAMPKTKRLLEMFYLSCVHDGTMEAKPLMSSKRQLVFPYQEVRDIAYRARKVTISPEIDRYLRDLFIAIRTHVKFKNGMSPRASTDLASAARALAAVHEKSHVTPDLVLILFNKVLGHRLFSYPAADQGIMNDTLQSVQPPLQNFLDEHIVNAQSDFCSIQSSVIIPMNIAQKAAQPPSTVKIVNRTLRRLLLKVHPDYFHSVPEKKALNQRSLQQLNRILGPVLKKDGKESSIESLFRAPIEVSFYTKEGNLFQQTFTLANLSGFPHSESPFPSNLPANERENLFKSTLTLEFLKYCKKFELSSVQGDIEKLEEYLRTLDEYYTAHNAKQSLPKGKTLKEIFEKGLRTSFSNPYTQSKGSISRMKKLPSVEEEWRAIFRSSKLVFKHRDVSSREYIECKEALSKHLVELGYSQWRGLPLMISTEFSRNIPGFLVIPKTFEKSQLQRYLENHLESIRTEYAELIRTKTKSP